VPRRLALPALVFAIAIVRPTSSAAHAGLRLSDPLEGVALGDSPTIVRLSFSEAPEPSLSSVRVLDPSGGVHQKGAARRAPDDPLSLLVDVGPLERGVYIVNWRTVSAVDGHASAGAYAFGVRTPVAGTPPAATAGAPTSTFELFARVVIIVGIVALLGGIGATVLGVEGAFSARLAVAGSLAALAGVVALAFAQRAAAGTTFTQLTRTAVGSALVWRIVAAVVSAVAAILAMISRATTARSLGLTVAAMGGLSLIVVHVAAGHAAASGNSLNSAAAVAVQAAHFAAASIWVGGLGALLIGMRGPASPLNAAAIRRFSTVAAVAFVVVGGTGLVRAVEALDSWDEATSTTYGRLVIAKAALFAAAAMCAALNRWQSVPAAARTLRPFRLTSSWELAILGGATLAAATLTASPPPSAERQAFALTAIGHDFGTTVRARVAAVSDQPGANRFVVRLSDYDSATPVLADRVSLRFAALDDPRLEPTILTLAAGPGDAYVGSGANMSFDGRWEVVVLVERSGSSVEVPLELETQVAPRSVTVQRQAGQAPSYMVEIWRAGLIRFRAEPERAGPARLQIDCFDFIGDPRIVDSMVVTIASRTRDSRTIQVPVRALARGRFVADVTLTIGTNTIAAVAHTPDGTRIRAKIVMNIPR
jgi:copper transport protein